RLVEVVTSLLELGLRSGDCRVDARDLRLVAKTGALHLGLRLLDRGFRHLALGAPLLCVLLGTRAGLREPGRELLLVARVGVAKLPRDPAERDAESEEMRVVGIAEILGVDDRSRESCKQPRGDVRSCWGRSAGGSAPRAAAPPRSSV